VRAGRCAAGGRACELWLFRAVIGHRIPAPAFSPPTRPSGTLQKRRKALFFCPLSIRSGRARPSAGQGGASRASIDGEGRAVRHASLPLSKLPNPHSQSRQPLLCSAQWNTLLHDVGSPEYNRLYKMMSWQPSRHVDALEGIDGISLKQFAHLHCLILVRNQVRFRAFRTTTRNAI
jgi:hypothetical protein